MPTLVCSAQHGPASLTYPSPELYPDKMVVFTCNLCGDSLKKNKVDQHTRQCRFSTLSCVDCLKDFSLQSYAKHIECITEDQKYGGLNYKQQEFKGKNKQNDWVQKIKTLINENQFPRDIQYVLKSLVTYDNIPRKKPKFLNFVKNSFRIRDQQLVDKIWDIFESCIKSNQPNSQNGSTDKQHESVEPSQNGTKRPIEENVDHAESGAKSKDIEKKQKVAAEQNDEQSSEVMKMKMKKIVKSIIVEYNELPIKKLRKKVLKHYRDNGVTDDSEINRKFDKVISKNKFVIKDNLVTLALPM